MRTKWLNAARSRRSSVGRSVGMAIGVFLAVATQSAAQAGCDEWGGPEKGDGFENALQFIEQQHARTASGWDREAETKVLSAVRCASDYTKRYLYIGFTDKKQAVFKKVLEDLSNPFGPNRVSTPWTLRVVDALIEGMGPGLGAQSERFWWRLLERQLAAGGDPRPRYRGAFVRGYMKDRSIESLMWALKTLENPRILPDVSLVAAEQLAQFRYPTAWQELARSRVLDRILAPEMWDAGAGAELRDLRQQGFVLMKAMAKDRPGANAGEIVEKLWTLLTLWSEALQAEKIAADRSLWRTWIDTLMSDETRHTWLYGELRVALDERPCATGPMRRMSFLGVSQLLSDESEFTRTKVAFFLLGRWGGDNVAEWVKARFVKKTWEEIERERQDARRRRENSDLWALLAAISTLIGGGGSTSSIPIAEVHPFPRLDAAQRSNLIAAFQNEFPNCH